MTDEQSGSESPTGETAAPPPSVQSGTRPGVPDLTGPSITAPAPDYSAAGVPSLDFVRDKIEGRYANSLGTTELAQETPEARTAQEQAAQREEAARERLAAIRRSLQGDSQS